MNNHCLVVLCYVFVKSLLFVLLFGLLIYCTVCTLSAVAGVVLSLFLMCCVALCFVPDE